MKELSVFVDESGTQEGKATYYLVTLVLHNQADEIQTMIDQYERSLINRALPNIPFHATPLLRAHDEYRVLEMATRKKLLSAFGVFVQKLPIKYASFKYKSSEFESPLKLEQMIKRDLSAFIFERLDYFQSFDEVKIYYDKGQPAVTKALKQSFEFALSAQAYVSKESVYRKYRLEQTADYLCAIELTAEKYLSGQETPTDIKFFGSIGSFK